VGHFATAVALLKGGTGFAWIPKSLIEKELRLGELQPINLVHRASFELPFHLVVPNPTSLGPAAQLLAKIIKQHHQ
jgi:DNA-binding transcriptional LysR family regulator